jgi:hypothetical protein
MFCAQNLYPLSTAYARKFRINKEHGLAESVLLRKITEII